ncbi:MAG: TIM barrel protein [Phycisphaerae bacterium]
MQPSLAVPPSAGIEVIQHYGLYIEAGPDLEDPIVRQLSDRVVCAHAPWMLPDSTIPGLRLHLASVDPQLRTTAIETIDRYIQRAHALFDNLKLIVTHAAPHYFPHPPVRPNPNQPRPPLRPDLARWDLLLDSLARLARRCQNLHLQLAVENNWAYWDGLPDQADPARLGPGDFLEYFCTDPDQWLSLPQQLGQPNVSCCLDPSHAAPYCHRFADHTQRRQVLARFIARPELIGHIHWNDSDIHDSRGKADLHLCVGSGTLGPAFHAAIKARAIALAHPVTLEHFYDPQQLERELAYIASL